MADISEIFEALIQPEQGSFSRELSQYVLGLKCPEEKVARYQDLADRVQDDALGPDERAELEAFVQANAILTILKLKARRSMLQHAPAA